MLSEQSLTQARYTLDKINRCLETLASLANASQGASEGSAETDQFVYDIKNGFTRAMEDDLKISGVISSILASVKTINRRISQGRIGPEDAGRLLDGFKEINSVLRVFTFRKKKEYPPNIQDLMKQRDAAREANNWKEADRLRNELIQLGIPIHDEKSSIDQPH